MSSSTGPDIITTGLVLHLDASDRKSYPGSGTTWFDRSENGNHGTLVGGPTYNSSNGGSIVFDGTNDYVLCPKPSSIVNSGQISISLWAKWITVGTSTSTIQALIDNNYNESLQGFVIQDRPDLSKSLTVGFVRNSIGLVSSFIVGNCNWHHIVATHNGSVSKLYIDGILDGQISEVGLAYLQPNISIGYWQFAQFDEDDGAGRYLNGSISLVQIYNRAIDFNEVKQNFNATRGRYGI